MVQQLPRSFATDNKDFYYIIGKCPYVLPVKECKQKFYENLFLEKANTIGVHFIASYHRQPSVGMKIINYKIKNSFVSPEG